MNFRLMSCLCLLGLFAASALATEPAPAPMHATTISKSAIRIGTGSFALTKGTKLEVLGREGDSLIVKFRSMQGKIPLAETDFDPETEMPPATAAEPKPKAVLKPAPVPAVTKPAAAASTTPAAPPALAIDGKPTTNYGKAVQKAKQVTETQKSTRVDPTKDIMDEQPKK